MIFECILSPNAIVLFSLCYLYLLHTLAYVTHSFLEKKLGKSVQSTE